MTKNNREISYEDFFNDGTQPWKRPGARVLVVEDDESASLIWDQVVSSASPGAQIDWVPTEEAAERMIRSRLISGVRYDLVIVDVFLAGRRTGVDLWRRYGVRGCQFLLVSGQDQQKVAKLFGNEAMPQFLHKPLNIKNCVETVSDLLRAA